MQMCFRMCFWCGVLCFVGQVGWSQFTNRVVETNVVQTVGVRVVAEKGLESIGMFLEDSVIGWSEREKTRILKVSQEELSFFGVERLSGVIVIQLRQSNTLVVVDFGFTQKKVTNMVRGWTNFSFSNWMMEIERVGMEIAGEIQRRYPPKPWKDIEVVEVSSSPSKSLKLPANEWSIGVSLKNHTIPFISGIGVWASRETPVWWMTIDFSLAGWEKRSYYSDSYVNYNHEIYSFSGGGFDFASLSIRGLGGYSIVPGGVALVGGWEIDFFFGGERLDTAFFPLVGFRFGNGSSLAGWLYGWFWFGEKSGMLTLQPGLVFRYHPRWVISSSLLLFSCGFDDEYDRVRYSYYYNDISLFLGVGYVF